MKRATEGYSLQLYLLTKAAGRESKKSLFASLFLRLESQKVVQMPHIAKPSHLFLVTGDKQPGRDPKKHTARLTLCSFPPVFFMLVLKNIPFLKRPSESERHLNSAA